MSINSTGVQPNWERLFSPDPYRFQLGLRAGRVREFFNPTGHGPHLLAERQRWLGSNLAQHCQVTEEGIPLLDEVDHLMVEWGLVRPSLDAAATARMANLGGGLEPDFLLMLRSPTSASRLVGGVVCFPSSWALDEKMGRPMAEIHGVVPGLNERLGPQIERFLDRLVPDTAWERENWGLSADAELNRHPSRQLAGLTPQATLESAWLRVEHQVLFGLPKTSGILFGIRLSLHRLDELALDSGLAARLARALTTMSEDVATYKGLAGCREALARQLLKVPG